MSLNPPRNLWIVSLLAVLLPCVLVTPVWAAPRYKIVALDILPGGMDSLAFGLNDQGQIVGDSRKDRFGHVGQSRPVVWDSSGQPTELWDDQNVGGSLADINNAGQIVGRYGSGSGIPLPTPGVPGGRAFVWSESTGRVDLGLQPFGNSMAVAINDGGQVVGTSEVLETVEIDGVPTELFVPRAFLWDPMDGIRDLGTLGGHYSFATGINNLGQIVGYAETADFTERAFIWDELSGMQFIDSTMNSSTRAWGTNDHGVVVGFDDGGGAFGWTATGGFSLLPFPLGTSSVAYDVNDHGQIVGEYQTIDSGPRAFLWDESFGIIDLQTDIQGGAIWDIEYAFAIDNAGHIVGYGLLEGQIRGFLMTPVPEPATMVQIALCILTFAFSSALRRIRYRFPLRGVH